MLREEMSGRFDKYLKRFFMSYSSEKELDEAQYKQVFKELDKLTDHKRWFLIFPYDKGNDNSFVDFLFPNKSYAVRKSDWKKPAKGSGEKHHLPSLADRKEYGGLFGLIAKAGLKHLDVGGDS
jgi:hypothetical protein